MGGGIWMVYAVRVLWIITQWIHLNKSKIFRVRVCNEVLVWICVIRSAISCRERDSAPTAPCVLHGEPDWVSILWKWVRKRSPSSCPLPKGWHHPGSYNPKDSSVHVTIKLGLPLLLVGKDFSGDLSLALICKRSYIILPFWLLVYETMFAKREDWQGLERSELLKYFNDCGHFPTQNQIDEYWDLFHRRECCVSHASPAFLCPLLALVLVPSLSVLFYLSFSRV